MLTFTKLFEEFREDNWEPRKRRPRDGRGRGQGPLLRQGPKDKTGPRAGTEYCQEK